MILKGLGLTIPVGETNNFGATGGKVIFHRVGDKVGYKSGDKKGSDFYKP